MAVPRFGKVLLLLIASLWPCHSRNLGPPFSQASGSGDQSNLILQGKQDTKLRQYKIDDFFGEPDSDE